MMLCSSSCAVSSQSRGILFVLRSAPLWELLPQEMGCGLGMTDCRRLRDWQKAGVWDHLQHAVLDRLGSLNGIDFSRASLDSASIAAETGRGYRSEPHRSR
jgi:transposase